MKRKTSKITSLNKENKRLKEENERLKEHIEREKTLRLSKMDVLDCYNKTKISHW